MTIYVAEIEGRAIAAFHAQTIDDARSEVVDTEWFKADLSILESDGRVLWDGTGEIHVREALEDERAKWDSSRAKAILAGQTSADDEDWITFLTPVDPHDEG